MFAGRTETGQVAEVEQQPVRPRQRREEMEPGGFTAVSKDESLPLASLRLLVPPVHLMTAWMWQVLKKQDVKNYWNVAEFVSVVVEMVPELLVNEHRSQLDLGLRARFILELCRSEQFVKPESILSYLNKMKSTNTTLIDMSGSEEDGVTVNFLNLTRTLLRDPEERRDFFTDVFPAEFGPQYDSDLLTLFSEFLCRLAQLLPVPDLRQTVSWLGTEASVLEDCSQVLRESTDLKKLLLHHRNLRHLEEHVPPYGMGENVLSSISAAHPRRGTEPAGQPDRSDPRPDPGDDKGPSASADDVAVEVITVSDYSEVEVSSGTNVEAVTGENQLAGDSQVVFFKENAMEEEEAKRQAASRHEAAAGPHDCPHCRKKFKFASSLLAHSVIHSGERPHHCSACGRSFSFRQSLDRHRRTHRTARTYECVVCKATFRSLSARTEHKQTHMRDGVYTCRRCNRSFTWELSLARHLKAQAGGCEDRPEDRPEAAAAARSISAADGDAQELGGERFSGIAGCPPSSGSGRPAPELDPVKVRTSGRKRVPTMKIQVINFQKRMSTKRSREMTANPPAPKTLPSVCSEHSYGSSVVSKDGDESSSADVSCSRCSFQPPEAARVQQDTDEVHAARICSDAEGRFTCADCGKSFEFQSLLKAHRRVHTGEQPFSCPTCGQRFSFKQSLERHQETHRSGRKLRCLICGQLFESAAEQREHKGAHMENGAYLCSECGQTFTWRSALVRHLKRHAARAGEVGESHRCPRCHQGFSRAGHLSRHMQTHKEERVHACNCGKSFAYRAALTAHQRTHQKERPHSCQQCGKGFLYRGGLLSHMKVHSEETPFMCSFCGKAFKRERNMKKHERCHTRENVFSCSQCDKSFVYKATLVRHELTHSGERPYLCSDCGKGFFSHAELLKHERFHTGHKPFQCHFCSKTFTQSCYLTVHLRYHTGVRPYSCSECDKSFLSANRLKRHQRTHSGEKPYLCGECGKGFRQSYHLKMHQRTHAS